MGNSTDLSMFSVLDLTSKDTSFIQNADLRLVQSQEDLEKALEWIDSHDLMAFDIETTGLSTIYDNIVGVSFGNSATSFYFPIGHRLDKNMAEGDFKKLLDALSQKQLIYHNAKFDWKFIFAKMKVDLPITHDTLAMAALLDSDRI